MAKGRSRCAAAPKARREEVLDALEATAKPAKRADTPGAKVAREIAAHIDDNIARMRAELAAPAIRLPRAGCGRVVGVRSEGSSESARTTSCPGTEPSRGSTRISSRPCARASSSE